MRNLLKNFVFVVLVFFVIAGVFSFLQQETKNKISITQLAQDINQEKIKKIIISGNNLLATFADGTKAESRKETELALSEALINYGADKTKLAKVEVEAREAGGAWNWLGPILFSVLPLLLFVGFFFFILRQAKGGGGGMQIFDFTKAKARLFGADGQPKEKITFGDVAGLKEAKEELAEVVDFLKNPKKYLQIGARIPRGVLLVGAPGTGKTLLAKAIANEANVPFFSISGSEFIELFVGVGAARTRDLFATAKKAGRAIIFIDEIDSIGRTRGVGVTGGHEEREQTLNQILSEMDGIGREEGLIIIGATNKPEVLDPALLRPGRFDRRIVLDLPDINDREEILKIHSRGKPLALNVKLREVAERTPGFSGADLANVVNEAALLAAKKNKIQVFQEDFLNSIEKVLLGPERKSHILSAKEKEIAAYHEAGHAVVDTFLPGGELIRKVSIIARGMAAGYTLKMPSEERKMKTRSEFLAEIATLLGGYVAEKIKFGEITTGASNDLAKASYLARKLVKEYGMSPLGPISFGEKEELAFLDWEGREFQNYSEKVAEKIDTEVERIIKGAEKTAQKILTKKRNLLEKVTKRLIEKETIEKEEFEELVGLKKIEKPLPKKEKSVKVKIRRV